MLDVTSSNSTYSSIFTPTQPSKTNIDESLSPIFKCSPQKNASMLSIGDVVKNLIFAFKNTLTKRLKMQLVRYLYQQIVIEAGGIELATFVQPNFLDISLNAMKTLHTENKENLIHDLSTCFKRRNDDDDEETRMPLRRMPFGLVDYNIRFFARHSSQKLKMEGHYAKWLETMYSHFGHKFLCLFRGPYWQYEEPDQVADCLPVVDSVQINSELVQPSNAIQLASVQSVGDSTVFVSDCMDLCADLESSRNDRLDACVEYGSSIIDDVLAEFKINLDEFPPPAMVNESHTSMEEDTNPSNSTYFQPKCDEVCVSPEAMELHHGIQPQQSTRKPLNSAMYDTMKVCMSFQKYSVTIALLIMVRYTR